MIVILHAKLLPSLLLLSCELSVSVKENTDRKKNTAIKDIRNRFTLGKENKVIRDRILRNIRNLFEHEEEENYYKSVRVSNL